MSTHIRPITELPFPPEIFRLIVSAVGCQNRRLLLPLLYVSRSVYHLAVEPLYEGLVIVLDLDPHGQYSLLFEPRMLPITPWVWVSVSRVPLLHALFNSAGGAHLAQLTRVVYIHNEPWLPHHDQVHAAVEGVRVLLSHLTKLKRLLVESLNDDPRIPALRITIPNSIPLTHLNIGIRSYAELFTMLQHYPHLRAVVIHIDTGDTPEPNSALNPKSLPNLRLYSGPPVSWDIISKASPNLESLDDQLLLPDVLPASVDLYSKIRFISVGVGHSEQLDHPAFPLLKKVEYLRVFVVASTYDPDQLTGSLMKVTSSSLKYISIRVLESKTPEVIETILESLFEAFPSLMVIDITVKRPNVAREQIVTNRHTRSSCPFEIHIPRMESFGHWWYDVQDEVEHIDRCHTISSLTQTFSVTIPSVQSQRLARLCVESTVT